MVRAHDVGKEAGGAGRPLLRWDIPQCLAQAIAPDAMGEALFVAKGCIQCHVNDNVTMAENMFQIGPDITFVKRPSEYLEVWLANPASIKVETIMPNLHLSAAEIETLIAFLKQQ